MTILDATNPALGGNTDCIRPSIPATSELVRKHLAQDTNKTSLPRFNLKKRSATVADPEDTPSLATVNSAFLSGLFADVANVQSDTPDDLSAVSKETIEEPADPRLDDSRSLKKSRVTLTKSISRCGRSFRILDEALDILKAPASPTGICDVLQSKTTPSTNLSSKRNDSLHFQLHCVSSKTQDGSPATMGAGGPVFPHLPATVSNTSCSTSTLSRINSDLQSSLAEEAAASNTESSYGWFVEMDDDDDAVAPNTGVNAYAMTSSSSSLAFQALSAPKATNHDAEVEWAKAADTVDDVLGDFF